MTADSPAGTLACPMRFNPQATTEPSAFSAKLWLCPAAIATTLVTPAGIPAKPLLVLPQVTTVPSVRNARLCALPPATAMAFVRPDGTLVWPEPFAPHATTEVPAVAVLPTTNRSKAIARRKRQGQSRDHAQNFGDHTRPRVFRPARRARGASVGK